MELAPQRMQPQPQPVIEVLLVTVKQASEALQVSERTVMTMIDTGKLDSVKIGDSRRIDIESVRKVAREGASLPTLVERAARGKR